MNATNPSHRCLTELCLRHSAKHNAKRGFTLLEVLTVMAFLAVIAGIVTLNFDKLVSASEEKPIDRVFVEALQDARILAATSGNVVYLSFDPQSEGFVLDERSRQAPAGMFDEEDTPYDPTKPVSSQQFSFDKADSTEVLFYPRLSQPNGMTARLDDWSSEPVKHMVFHPSGAATPAHVVIRQPGLEDIEVDIDAFSSGPLKKAEG